MQLIWLSCYLYMKKNCYKKLPCHLIVLSEITKTPVTCDIGEKRMFDYGESSVINMNKSQFSEIHVLFCWISFSFRYPFGFVLGSRWCYSGVDGLVNLSQTAFEIFVEC